jgi:hypothetical protein
MRIKKLLIIPFFCLIASSSHAQSDQMNAGVDRHSLALYNGAQWKDLLLYGKEKIAVGINFPLLRMRVGYAAYMLGNYSESLLQYDKVYESDHDNKVALYYLYLNNLYLNNDAAARYYASLMPPEKISEEKIAQHKLSSVQTEYSYKMPQDTARENAQYARVGFDIDMGYKLQLQQSIAYYTLNVNMGLTGNTPVYKMLQQPEYYAKLTYAATGKLFFIGSYHYICDQFPDTIFQTNILLAGIKYSTPYVNFQANASFGNFAVNYTQYDGIVTIYPFGNLNLYSISRLSFGTQTNFSQVIGAKVSKSIWLEGNATFGKQSYSFEKDALYVKNDIDPNLFKCGVGFYGVFSKKCMLTLNYIFEQRQKQFSPLPNIYYQHSINGGLTWKF